MVHSKPPVPPGMVLIIPQDTNWAQSCWERCSCPQALLPPLHGNLNAERNKCPLLKADLVCLCSPKPPTLNTKFRGVKQMNYSKALNSRICTTGNPSCTQTWVLHADRPLALVSRLLRIWGNSSPETSKIGEELVWFPRDQEISRLSFFLSHRSQEEKESCWEVQDRKAHKCTMPPSWKCKIENRTQLSFLD